MDKTSLIIGLAILLLFVLPFIFIRIASNKKHKAINDLCKANGMTIEDKEEIGNITIALDATNKKLLVVDFDKPRTTDEIISLNGVKCCNIFGDNAKSDNEPIGLQLCYAEGNTTDKRITLCESTNDLTAIENACRLSKTWKAKIASVI